MEGMELSIRMVKNDKRIFGRTCFNQLQLPVFESKEAVKEAVMTAVNSVKLGISVIED